MRIKEELLDFENEWIEIGHEDVEDIKILESLLFSEGYETDWRNVEDKIVYYVRIPR